MNEIVRKQVLNESVHLMEVTAPAIARKAEPGQFIILMARPEGERIPLTIADFDREKGTVTIIFQIVGATTRLLGQMQEGDTLSAFVGPLGVPTHTEGMKRVAVVGGGVGCAIAFPVCKKLFQQGVHVDAITGFRGQDLVILEDDFSANATQHVKVSDDGTWGQKGLVTDALKALIEGGAQYDHVIAIGPLVMMKFVAKLTKEYNIPTTVSMNPIMIDGTGMCGGCRLSVGGKMKFACVDGPDFDGHEVDFDEAMERSRLYFEDERAADSHLCNLLKQGGAL